MPSQTSSVGANIRAARTAAGFTREQLAPRLGVTASTVYRWERDRTEPSFAKLGEIAAALGVTVASLWPSNGRDAS